MYRGEPHAMDVAYQERCRSRVQELERRNMLILADDAAYDRYIKLLVLQHAAAEHTDDRRKSMFYGRYSKHLWGPDDGVRRVFTPRERQQAEAAREAARFLVSHDQAARQNNAVLFSQPETIEEATYRRLEMPFVYELMRLMCESESLAALLAKEVTPPQKVRWVAPGIPEEEGRDDEEGQRQEWGHQEGATTVDDEDGVEIDAAIFDHLHTPEQEPPVEPESDHHDDGVTDHHEGSDDHGADDNNDQDDGVFGF